MSVRKKGIINYKIKIHNIQNKNGIDNVDSAVKTAIKQRIPTEVRGIKFFYKSGMIFIKLPFGRMLSYVKPRIGENKFVGESVTYEGIGSTKKWERIESYDPKFV